MTFNIDQLVAELDELRDTVNDFADTFTRCQTFSDPGSGVAAALGCGEANAFADLLDVLGLTDLATDFRVAHADSEDEATVRDAHEHWPDGIHGQTESAEDRESSASRQHYIDTGRYLKREDTSDPEADMEGELPT